jgi:hypothetical protein
VANAVAAKPNKSVGTNSIASIHRRCRMVSPP